MRERPVLDGRMWRWMMTGALVNNRIMRHANPEATIAPSQAKDAIKTSTYNARHQMGTLYAAVEVFTGRPLITIRLRYDRMDVRRTCPSSSTPSSHGSHIRGHLGSHNAAPVLTHTAKGNTVIGEKLGQFDNSDRAIYCIPQPVPVNQAQGTSYRQSEAITYQARHDPKSIGSILGCLRIRMGTSHPSWNSNNTQR